ncbi:MAG: hypothetical protein ACYCV4_19885 [Dermatophilaceae bacterium]
MVTVALFATLAREAFVLSGGLVEEAPACIEPLRRRAADLRPFPPGSRIGDLGAQVCLVGAVVAARSVLQAQGAPEAALDAPDCPAHGRTSGCPSREVE